jgi:hypothetical protein
MPGNAAMMDELIQEVARTAGLPAAQAALVVATVLRFFTARLPSALVGELHARLNARATPPGRPDDPATPGPPR